MMITDTHMLQLLDSLKACGAIRFDKQFCDAIGMTHQQLWNVQNIEGRHFQVEHIRLACKVFNVDANWIFGFAMFMFRDKEKGFMEVKKDFSRKKAQLTK